MSCCISPKSKWVASGLLMGCCVGRYASIKDRWVANGLLVGGCVSHRTSLKYRWVASGLLMGGCVLVFAPRASTKCKLGPHCGTADDSQHKLTDLPSSPKIETSTLISMRALARFSILSTPLKNFLRGLNAEGERTQKSTPTRPAGRYRTDDIRGDTRFRAVDNFFQKQLTHILFDNSKVNITIHNHQGSGHDKHPGNSLWMQKPSPTSNARMACRNTECRSANDQPPNGNTARMSKPHLTNS